MFTDFVDNSAGVDCSDHEVNIKILLDSIVNDGDLTMKQRNELLDSMTDAVGALVLEDNYQQTQALSLAASRSSSIFDEYIRFMQDLERTHLLRRDIEFLPSDKALAKRKSDRLGFTRPELAILLSYSKISLKHQLLQDPAFFDDQALIPYLEKAFPEVLCKRYPTQLQHHRLHNEIIATQLAGAMGNRMGATFAKRIYDEAGSSTTNIAKSYIVSNEVFDMDTLWKGIQALDAKIPASVQNEMLMAVVRLIRRTSRWFLRNRRVGIDVAVCISSFKPFVTELTDHIADVLAGEELEKLFESTSHFENHGVPHALAMRVASCRALVSALDIVEAALSNQLPVQDVAKIYFALGAYLELDWFRAKISAHEVNNNWDALARAACRDDVDRQQRSITESILQHTKYQESTDLALKAWGETVEMLVTRWRFMLADLKATTSQEFTMYAVALRELLDLAQSSHSHTAAIGALEPKS
jgi:glutamate dehydrogenase